MNKSQRFFFYLNVGQTQKNEEEKKRSGKKMKKKKMRAKESWISSWLLASYFSLTMPVVLFVVTAFILLHVVRRLLLKFVQTTGEWMTKRRTVVNNYP